MTFRSGASWREYGRFQIDCLATCCSSIPLYPSAEVVAGPKLHASAGVDHNRCPGDVTCGIGLGHEDHKALARCLRASAGGGKAREPARIKAGGFNPWVNCEVQAGNERARVRSATHGSLANRDAGVKRQNWIAGDIDSSLRNVDVVAGLSPAQHGRWDRIKRISSN